MRFKFTEVMGARTRYLHAGNGPALILVHGTGLTADSWFLNVPELAKHFSVYAPDLLDNGYTEAGPYTGGAPQPLCVEHLIEFADHLGIERFALLGNSFGCNIATLLYEQIPDRVERLVLVGPGSAFDRPGDWRTMYKGAYLNGRQAIEDPTFENCRIRMQNAVYDKASIPDALLLVQMAQYATAGALESFERRMSGLRQESAIKEYEIRSRLEQIRVPTLVILGRQDPRGNFDQACESAMRIKDAELVAYHRCGHWPHIEHPETFNRDVTDFLLAKIGNKLLEARAT
jgi:pimeloyl-ACP methyl ester carboxylesterase